MDPQRGVVTATVPVGPGDEPVALATGGGAVWVANARARTLAKIELDTRDSANVTEAARKWAAALDKSDPAYYHHMLEALWVHQWHNVVNEGLLKVLNLPAYGGKDPGTNWLLVPSDLNFAYSPVMRTLVESVGSYSHFERAATLLCRNVGVSADRLCPKPAIWLL